MFSETTYADIFGCNTHSRKGKHKPKNKRQRKYVAKSQKMNLIRSKNHKVIYNSDAFPLLYGQTMYNELLDILETTNFKDWNDDHEYLYELCKLGENQKYAKQYEDLLYAMPSEYDDGDNYFSRKNCSDSEYSYRMWKLDRMNDWYLQYRT
jgi:hypothetical protein